MKCKYCAIAPNGDIPDDGTFEELLDMDFSDEIEADGEFSNKDREGYESRRGTVHIKASHDFNAHIGISEGNMLSLDVWDPIQIDPQFHTDIRINFCPMCGRKLEAFKYDDE